MEAQGWTRQAACEPGCMACTIIVKLDNPIVDEIWNVSNCELGSQGRMADGVESLGPDRSSSTFGCPSCWDMASC